MRTVPLKTHRVSTAERSQIVDITPLVQQSIPATMTSGFVIVYVPHTTAGVTINENADPDVKSDLLKKLSAMIPRQESYYDHSEGNSDSHVKTALVGNSATVLVEDGRLLLGRWQGVYFCEFDGPRKREFYVRAMNLSGEAK